jgi:hypothetical protein
MPDQPQAQDARTGEQAVLADDAARQAQAASWKLIVGFNVVFWGGIAWFALIRDLVAGYAWAPWAYWGGIVAVSGILGIVAWAKSNTSRQVLLLTVVVAPALLGIVVGIAFTPPQWQFSLIRIGFILVACLLPAAMYYLFIVTRKGSLLNEFVANMDRLGVLGQQRFRGRDQTVLVESEISRRRRVEAYLQKFEAAFGPITDERARNDVVSDDPNVAAQAYKAMRVGLAAVFVSEAAVPVLIATFLLALLWVVTLPPVGIALAMGLLGLAAEPAPLELVSGHGSDLAPWWNALRPNLFPTTAAFLGAYYFSLQLLFYRYIRRDLRPSAYVSVVRRIIIAVTSVWIIEAVAIVAGIEILKTQSALVVAGFVIGVFPRVLLQMLEVAWKKIAPTIRLPSFESDLPINELDGLTLWHESRFEEEDIENVPNVASADLPELMINTRFPAHRLVDWVDQAILYTCLGPADKENRRRKLRSHGIRTATAFTETYRQASYKDKDKDTDVQAFERMLGTEPRSEMRGIADAIELMPNTRLVRVWRALDPDGFRKPPLSGLGTSLTSPQPGA